MALPDAFLQHLRERGYDPRSNKHSNALAEAIIADLVSTCATIHRAAAAGDLVYDVNFTIRVGRSDWNIDLVLGQPPPPPQPEAEGIRRATQSSVQIAIEMKSIMTAHRNNAKNRRRDLQTFSDHGHGYDRRTIVGGLTVANISPILQLPRKTTVNRHLNVERDVAHCLDEIRDIDLRSTEQASGLDASAFLVVAMDNIDLGSTRYAAAPPAPQVGDPLHYDAFIQRICAAFTQRFAG